MMLFILSIGAFIPLWIIPSGFSALSAGAFCVQFGVQGAWGVIPIQLAEMSPPSFRATVSFQFDSSRFSSFFFRIWVWTLVLIMLP